ncbi:PucR family transcriptional regulator [Chengkuizengella axinellae]|uniref:PucR family transcriptional regulator ligand-binding domain-containing protein n=1 Tax=Chengkuizengella axinellae TaxID=3064388 RepID=A0ABT9IY20_9BACL|nr:PucR family transcriptional regulator [Chengkuizengella sp. 2205SS18-9]MDP5274251.1 PucR family transcriptional regulator ligand-binding domain-containing protein [Chengkuizengella sp. 2205SS18-9]
MEDHFQLKIIDILKRKYFNKTSIAAGHKGLNRVVTWVHVVEVTNIRKLLNGQELILSTGLGWQENEALFVSFIQQLIEAETSGLCIELGTYTSVIPQKVIEIANEHHFPIILFLEEVPFVKITQDIHFLLVNQHYLEEKRKAEENRWLREWLEGSHSEQEIHEYLVEQTSHFKLQGGVVCIYRFQSYANSNSDHRYFIMICRSAFEQHGFKLYAIEERNAMIFLLVNIRNEKDWKSRVEASIYCLSKTEYIKNSNTFKPTIGVGKFMKKLSTMNESYQTAMDAVRIKSRLTNDIQSYFYDDLHIYRFILILHKYSNLQTTAQEYLKPIIDYDKKYNGKLLETLKIYLACNGSKQDTAKRLFIVRQTLYHRMNKLKELIGDHFLNHDTRLAIEFMILAFEYLQSSEDSTK